MEINKHASVINKTSNYKKTVTEYFFDKKTVDYNVTQCKNCSGPKGVCHDGCGYGNGEEKRNCCAMNSKTGKCTHCGCDWWDHTNSNIVYFESSR